MENLQGGTLALEHHYHLDERLDSFGLVTTYAGTQDPFALPVRVTVYGGLVEADADPHVADRIKEAAQRSSHLRHLGLLPTVDFGEIEEGVPFVIEKTVPGPSLANRIEAQSVFSPSDVASLVVRLATVLQTAHDEDLYHGCLKPEWIFFPSDDAPLESAHLAHFGIAPSMSELVSMGQAVLTTDLVDAFPPESFNVAARDQSDDPQSDSPRPHLSAAADQWGLAALAYRLLVGVHPFFDDPVDASEGILRIKTEEPPPLGEMGVDEELSDVVHRALSRDPERRWPNIEAFGRAFQRAVTGTDDLESTSEDDADSPRATDAEPPSSQSRDIVDDQSQPSSLDDDPHGPRPSGHLLTIALAALLLTNLGWFFTVLHGESDDEEQEEPSVAQASEPDILPPELTGTQIETEPASSEVVEIQADGTEEILDVTPFSVTELLGGRSQVEILLRQPGYHDHRLIIDASETRQDIQLDLIDATDDT